MQSYAATKEEKYLKAARHAEELLDGTGAVRIHGGGFAGTLAAFVPLDRLERFMAGMDAAACCISRGIAAKSSTREAWLALVSIMHRAWP